MQLHPNATILEHFMYYMDRGENKKAEAIELGYNFLEDCFELDVSFEPIDPDESDED